MSALRNAVKRKTHKERSQPGDRRKFGLLEKKKDYVLRARDFHKKEDAIKALKTKAAYRNPDEFYFGMQRNRTKDGVHVGRADESNKYTAEELALMKTQDVKYVALKASEEAKKAAKLKANLHRVGLDADEDAVSEEDEERYDDEGFAIRAAPRRKRKHTVFVDDAETARAFDAKEEETRNAFLRRETTFPRRTTRREKRRETGNGPSAAAARALGVRRHRTRAVEAEENGEDGITGEATELDPRTEKRLAKKKRVAYALLREREKRAARLRTMAAEMALRREISHARGHKRKVRAEEEEDTPEGLRHLKKAEPQFKWKKERKR
jgi:U3 small nucleolar RNA-associated protein 11